MNLYDKSYNTIISTLANSIYNKVNGKSSNISTNATFRTLTSNPGLTNLTRSYGSSAVPNVVTTEKISSGYSKPTAASIKNDIIIFIKNTLGFTDSTLNQYPNGSGMLGFIFALNYYLENTLSKVAISADNSIVKTTIVYKPITSGHNNKITLNLNNAAPANRISSSVINEMYGALRALGHTNNASFALTTTASTTSSSSSSSCSSSCSSSSSSSSSSFIAYFNLN